MIVKPRRAASPDASTAPFQRRGLSVEEAADYVGLSVTLFEKQIKAGIFPVALPLAGRRKVYDRNALDQALDKLSELPVAAEKQAWRDAILAEPLRKRGKKA